jgi:hypothetical protein
MDRLEAAVVIGVEQCQLLAAVNPVLGVVDVEHDATGDLLEAVAEQLDHRRHHPLERGRAGQVLQPADGRLRAQIGAALGQPTDRHLESRVGTERIAIVAVGIARRDQQGAEADHLGQRMPHPLRRTRVLDAISQTFGDPKPPLGCRQQQYPGVRGHQAAVKRQVHRLARHRWQTRQNPRTFVHGGRELRCPRLILEAKSYTNPTVYVAPASLFMPPRELFGLGSDPATYSRDDRRARNNRVF